MAITYGRRLPVRSAGHSHSPPSPASFLGLPVEIRLQIYSYLLSTPPTYTFEIRTLQPQQANFYHYKRRSKYSVPTTGGLYSSSASTTYYLANAPGSGSPSDSKLDCSKEQPLYSQILSVCRTIYLEARPLLYCERTFSFSRDITAIVPFFSDLLPSTRSLIHSISLTHQASWRSKDFDDAVWRHTCEFLADHAKIERIKLHVVTAKLPALAPGSVVNMPNQRYKAEEFRTLLDVGYEGVEWIRDFLLLSRRWTPQDDLNGGRWYLPGWGNEQTEEGEDEDEDGGDGGGRQGRKGLKELVIEEEVEHCPKIDNRSSGSMAFYVTFSRSLKGFERFLRGEMLDVVDEWGRKAT